MPEVDSKSLQAPEEDQPKLITVVRADLHSGYALTQSCHAIADFAATHGSDFKEWHLGSNSLVCLQVPDEAALRLLYEKLRDYGEPMVMFEEPDIENQMTAICVLGTKRIRNRLRYLSLALKGRKQRAIEEHTGKTNEITINA